MPQYQGVWTLEQQALAQSNQQWVTDPNFKNTTLLLQADGTGSGSQNQTFLDGSTNNFFITRNGNTTQGSFSPFSQAPGYWSNYFDGTDDDLSIASNVNLTPAAGDFTLECWIFPTSWASLGSYRSVIGGPVSGCMFFGQTSTGFGLRALAVADVVVTTTLPPTNAWTHVAVSRSGTSARLFINGALVATATDSTNFAQTQVVIANTSVAGTEEYSGYISNLRFIKGTALYTSAFTPQTSPLTAVTNTQLLTCQSNRFVDNSANAFSLSVGGTPSVQAFGPFAPALQWTPDVVGGSGYFDGTGDYLTFTDSSNALDIGSVNVSCEAWVYSTASVTGGSVVVGKYGGSATWNSTNGWEWILAVSATNFPNLQYYISGTSLNTITSSKALALNSWNHLAIATDTSTNISLFLNGERVATTTGTVGKPTTRTSMLVAGPNSNLWTGYLSGMRFLSGSNAYSASSSSITVPTASPTSISGTSLLLNYTNAGIYDGKMANNLETVGNAQVSTSVVKYGSGSMYFPGATTDYLSIPDKDLLEFGTASFTVEAWVFPTLIAGDERPIWSHGTNSSNWMSLYITSSGYVEFAAVATSTIVDVTTPVTVPLSTWTHIALVRNNNIFKIYINGIDVGSSSSPTTTSSAIGSYSDSFRVGGPRWSGGSDAFQGFIDDLRITLAARYFTTFTPPQQALPRQ